MSKLMNFWIWLKRAWFSFFHGPTRIALGCDADGQFLRIFDYADGSRVVLTGKENLEPVEGSAGKMRLVRGARAA